MTAAARIDTDRPMGQQLRLARLGAIVRERAALEAGLLLLDVEEDRLLSTCEHCDENGEPFVDPLCHVCEAPLV